MAECNRREWLVAFTRAGLGTAALATSQKSWAKSDVRTKVSATYHAVDTKPLPLVDYQPKSMLHVPETHVQRSRYPNIDFHSHLSWVDRKGQQDVVRNAALPDEILQVMDAKNVRVMVNLTGGYGNLLNETVQHWQQPHPDRFLVFTEPWYAKSATPNYSKFQAEQLEVAKK